MDQHIVPLNEDHETNPGCPCRPVLIDNTQVWVHRSFDGRELDEAGHLITLPAPLVERMVMYLFDQDAISKEMAIEVLQITEQAFERRKNLILPPLN